MTDDLIARLRMYEPQYLNRESADALEAKNTEISRLKQLMNDWYSSMARENEQLKAACAGKDAYIVLLKQKLSRARTALEGDL